MRIERSLPVIGTVLLATAGLVLAQSDPPLQRLSSEFQNVVSGVVEAFTTNAALPGGAGGLEVYRKNLAIPTDVNVIYITFSAQADVHNGSALLMNARVAGTPIEPLLGSTVAGPHTQSGWWTLLHLPQAGAGVTNCNDGGGGTADCHDNTIHFSGCARVVPGSTVLVTISLADLPGGDNNFAFYERSTINIDGLADLTGSQCRGVGTGLH
jgi:hypothetical protein